MDLSVFDPYFRPVDFAQVAYERLVTLIADADCSKV